MSTMELEMPVSEVELFEGVKQNSLSLLGNAKARADIKSSEDFIKAGEYRRLLNGWKKEAEEKCEPVVSAAYATWKAAVKLRDEAIAPLKQAIAILDPALTAWQTEQDRLRRIEQERLQKEAKAREEVNALAEATAVADGGDHDRASAILDRVQVAPVVVPVAPKADGLSFREQWSCDSEVDMRKLVIAVFNEQVPLEALMPNMAILNQMARALKDKLNYPGVKVVCKKIVSSR